MALVYDCFTFFNELDVLEIRLNELDGVVDRFVIAEANMTHAGAPREFILEKNMDRFEKFRDKIIYIKVEDMPTGGNWGRENYQRDALMRGLVGCDDDDIVLISDVDEIPRPSCIKDYKISDGMMNLEQNMYYYYLNCFQCKWYLAKILPFRLLREGLTPELARETSSPCILNAGWHFSFIGGLDKITEKIEAFAHQEFNTDEYKNHDHILEHMTNGTSLFGRWHDGAGFVQVDDTFPRYVVENQDKLSQFIRSETLKS